MQNNYMADIQKQPACFRAENVRQIRVKKSHGRKRMGNQCAVVFRRFSCCGLYGQQARIAPWMIQLFKP